MSLDDRREFIGRCTRCSQCKFVPTPVSQEFASACPSIDYGQFHSYSASGKLIGAYALLEGKADFSPELVRSLTVCTMCGACDTACKVNLGETVEPLDTLYEIRAHLAQAEQLPEAHKDLISKLRSNGNTQGLTAEDRTRWAEGLDLAHATAGNFDILIHVGSQAAADPELWPSMRKVIERIRAKGLTPAYLGADESSCGSLAFELGYVNIAHTQAKVLAEKIHASQSEILVTFSATAFAAFRGIYPRFDIGLENIDIHHISHWLTENALQDHRHCNVVATYHDPCKLGRLSEPHTASQQALGKKMNGIYISPEPKSLRFGNLGEYESPRRLLQSIDGLKLVEMQRNRASAYCCGAGGGAIEAYPDFAEFAAINRLKEAVATGASIMVSGCSGCASHLSSVAKSKNIPIKVVELLTFIDASESSYVNSEYKDNA